MNLGSETAAKDPGAVLALRLQEAAVRAGQWTPRHFARGDTCLGQGAPDRDIRVVVSGILKLVYITPSGEERIKSLIADRGVFVGTDLDETGAESPFSAICITPATVARLPISLVRGLLGTSPALQQAEADFRRWLFTRKQARAAALLCDDAETRYLNFTKDNPHLAARLPQGDIARWIGNTPIAFSRIKRRLRPS